MSRGNDMFAGAEVKDDVLDVFGRLYGVERGSNESEARFRYRLESEVLERSERGEIRPGGGFPRGYRVALVPNG